MRQLFDVLSLLADDGPDGKRWDEKVDSLRLWVTLQRTRWHVSASAAARQTPNSIADNRLLQSHLAS